MMSSYINGAVGSLSTPHQRFDLTSDLDNGPRICAESRMQKTNIRPRVCYLIIGTFGLPLQLILLLAANDFQHRLMTHC